MAEIKTTYVIDSIKNILSKTDTDLPFCVADFSDVLYKFRYWKHKLPRIEPFFAVKCNPDPVLLRLMTILGIHFDCASKKEIDDVLSAGAEPCDIIYAHPIKYDSFLRYAESVGVDLMTFDYEDELHKIKRFFPSARLVLRIEIPNVKAIIPLNRKFGVEMKNIPQLLKTAKYLEMQIVGVSFHVGSLCEQPSAFKQAINLCRQVFNYAQDLGFNFTLLDIGGGFPGTIETFDVFEKMCFYINKGLEEHFPETCGVRVIAEPGCYMVCSAYNLCTKILARKIEETIGETGDSYDERRKIYYYLNDGTFGSFPSVFKSYGFQIKKVLSRSDLTSQPVVLSTLWGVTCSSVDCIINECLLPELNTGDNIVFENMGAYSQSVGTNFNGFAVPATFYTFSPHSEYEYQNHKLPSYEDFCCELGSNRLEDFRRFQEFISQKNSQIDLFLLNDE